MTAVGQLYERIASRDREAMSQLYDQYAAALYGVIIRIVKSQEIAEDLLQETFTKIWRNAESYDPAKATYYTWMLNIARNTAIDKVRSASYRHGQKIQSDVSAVSEMGSLMQETYVDHIGLDKLLSQLSDDQRAVIDLVYFHGYTQKEVHEELNIPLGTVKTRLRIAMRDLRKLLGISASMTLVLIVGHMQYVIEQMLV